MTSRWGRSVARAWALRAGFWEVLSSGIEPSMVSLDQSCCRLWARCRRDRMVVLSAGAQLIYNRQDCGASGRM